MMVFTASATSLGTFTFFAGSTRSPSSGLQLMLLELRLDILGDPRRLPAYIRHGDDLPIIPLGHRPHGPNSLACAVRLVDLQPDADPVDGDQSVVQHLADDGIYGLHHGMQRPGAVD